MKRLLIIRFSAMGDVAMTIPILCSVATRYPDLQITVLSKKALQPLFEAMPSNVEFMAADIKGRHKGIRGLMTLYRDLRALKFDAVADLHNVLRTRYLRVRFRMGGVPVAVIDKGRAEKRALVRSHRKEMRPLKTSFERYREVFAKLGLSVEPDFTTLYPRIVPASKASEKWVGIAPFAAHKGKIYPLDKMEEVLRLLLADSRVRLFLFGGPSEVGILNGWAAKYPHIESLPDKNLGMAGEIRLMGQLDAMLTMDSGNMHLASLVATPVVSVWGATHPWCGFMGWNQPFDNAVQLEMPCRPCSVYGNKPCLRGDYACLNIAPQLIVDKIKSIIE